ncbi:MAG: choice-of-anchor D domain-containing protein [Acidobacteriota bacterium]|nr:choice-of-anchor D domain-containing protein [Acidobacteriota bacterium]
MASGPRFHLLIARTAYRGTALRPALVATALITLALPSPGIAQHPAESLTGILSVRWGDPPASSAEPALLAFDLTEANGVVSELAIDAETLRRAGGISAINGRVVEVQRSGDARATAAIAVSVVSALRVLSEANETFALSAATVSGSKPWASILCKFADDASEPQDLAFFQNMYANAPGRLDHYWREVSANQIDVVGSMAAGWFTLPKPRADYLPNGSVDLTALFSDCTAAADSEVDFSNGAAGFEGINMMFNDRLDCCAWGGTRYATLDGVTKVWRVTWEPPWGWDDEGVIAHEMGHGFGLPHSNNWDGDSSPYDNPWDVMSAAQGFCVTDPIYGRLGKHTIAHHKDSLGWIAPSEIYIPVANGIYTLTIDRLSIETTANYRMARIPVGTTGRDYVVEVREQVGGYDGMLPGNAVLIFEVDPGRREPAWLVDSDQPPANYASNEGSMWRAGETFEDPDNDIWISVDGASPEGFTVSLGFRNPPDLTLAPTALDHGEVEVGSESTAIVTLTNLSTVFETAVVSATSVSEAPFSLDADGGASPCGTLTPTLAATASCTMAVEFAPTAAGIVNATLSVDSNAAVPSLEIALTGTGVVAPCPFADHVVLPDVVETGVLVREACLTITGGPFQIESPGNVTLLAGELVILQDGFTVGTGAALTIEIQ